MKSLMMLVFSAFVIVGCSKEGDRGDKTASSKPSTVEPDNTGTIVADDKLSTSAQNVKIVTNDGKVTLRGPVKSEQEKKEIETKAKQVAGVKNVENQLEIATN